MAITEEEKQKIIWDYNRKRMAKAGRSRSPEKRKAAQQNIRRALAVRWGKPMPKKEKK